MEELTINIVEGDFGYIIPIEIESDIELTTQDTFSIKIFEDINIAPLIIKDYSNIKDNTINFILSLEDTKKLKKGIYFYDIDWLQNETFMKNIVAKQKFVVDEKAGVVNESTT